ncbi:MAG: hypothetical protein IJ303_02695 [Clostridia bacterium]|nr:hypothetical protein [Clostridia bacterium]
MAIYTYDDFEKAAAGAGMLSQFSDADLRLAKANPDAGMSLLKYKKDYMSAKTATQKELANAGAEKIRSSYGGYTGGGDGGSFHLEVPSPNDFSFSDAPAYESRYDDKINALLDSLSQRQPFSYDPESDPLYGAAKKAYTREARRATADTLASASAAGGGVPSSYAVTAARQAGDYYASQLPDKMQDLYQLAYNQYVQEHNMKLSELSAVQSAEQSDYQRYLSELEKHNADRSFAYGQHIDEINNQSSKRAEELSKSEAEYERQLSLAKLAASAGDYSYLEKLLGGKISTPAVSVSGYTGTSSAPGYTADYDKERFEADLAFAQKRDKAENTQKYSQKVFADFDAGKYSFGGDQPEDKGGDVDSPVRSDLNAVPHSLSDFKANDERARNNMAYNYLKNTLKGEKILTEAEWRNAKNAGGAEASYKTYGEYLDALFAWHS